MKDLKYSRQRSAILEELKNRHDHPTADVVYQSLRKDHPHISLGTVYRNLNLLSDLKVISRFDCGDGMIRFDPRTEEHYHFLCRECGRVSDLDMPPIESLNKSAAGEDVGCVLGHSLVFFGCCRDCYRAKGNERGKAAAE